MQEALMKLIPYAIVAFTILSLGGWLAGKYNGIIIRRNKREQSFSNIDVFLKQRFDLIPQLMETVKGYMKHEKELLENVTKARSGFMNAQNTDEKIKADNMLAGTLKTLFAVSENYPDLKASQNFQQFQNQITEIENNLSSVRTYFNETTTDYNTYIEIFPNNIIAGIFNFARLTLFEAPEDREVLEKRPEVKF